MLIKCKLNAYRSIKFNMNNQFPPNLDPNLYALIATLIGAVMVEEFNTYELNSIGNWLELLGQYLLSAASQAQLINYRFPQNTQNANNMDYLLKAMQMMAEELEKIKKKLD